MSARTHAFAPREGRRSLRIAAHVLFWLAALAFYTLYFGGWQNDYEQSLIFVSVLLPITIATTYFLIYWLIPRYLLTRRYGFFVLYFCYTLLFSFYLELALVVTLFITVAEYQALVVRPNLTDQLDVIAGMYLIVVLAIALQLLRRWHSMQTRHARLEQTRLETEVKLREAELARLKSQMHPHFLFNTLNNLYGLTLEQSKAAPDVVLRIADLLDYMLYRCDQPLVPLAGEIEHLRTYLELERLRYDDRVEVTFDVDNRCPELCVAPLLLVPFVENSFKHGASRAAGKAWIHVHLHAADEQLHFTVANSKPAVIHRENGSAIPDGDTTAGIGLKNVRQRIRLLYPGAHDLDVCEEATQFTVHLHLPLHQCDTTPNDAKAP